MLESDLRRARRQVGMTARLTRDRYGGPLYRCHLRHLRHPTRWPWPTRSSGHSVAVHVVVRCDIRILHVDRFGHPYRLSIRYARGTHGSYARYGMGKHVPQFEAAIRGGDQGGAAAVSLGLTVRRRGSGEEKGVQTSTEWIHRGMRRREEKYHTNHDLHIQEMSKVHLFFPFDDYMLSFHRFVYMLLSSSLSFKSHCPRCPHQRAAGLISFDGLT